MPDTPEAILRVRGLSKSYDGLTAVNALDLELRPGEIFGLLGPNGAGKTSTLECILGLRQPDSGSVMVCGFDAAANPAQARRCMGAQLQQAALQDRISPRQALSLFASFHGLASRVPALLRRFDLVEKADEPFASLSAGQRQRLSLALALVNEPTVLLLDEPTAGLDPKSRRELHGLIRELRDAGCAILLCTHLMDEAQQLCDRVGILHKGVLKACASPAEIVARSGGDARIKFRINGTLEPRLVSSWPSVRRCRSAQGTWIVECGDPTACIAELAVALQARGLRLADLQIEKPTLEDAFLSLTGRPLTSDEREVPGSPTPATEIEEGIAGAGVVDNPAVPAEVPGRRREPVERVDPGETARGMTNPVAAWDRSAFAGLLRHFLLTLRLNLRSAQAMVYGYVVPIFFLLAFGTVFRDDAPPLLGRMGQILTITILGGACIGLPTALVAERERGVWRRYRLLPVPTSSLVVSTLLARLVIVGSALVLQLLLAWSIFGTPLPQHPVQTLAAMGFVCLSFMGLGMLVASLANEVPAVQALGQCLFLPMIMVGGVGIPLEVLPAWVKSVAGFMPGRYAVGVLQAPISAGQGTGSVAFSYLALVVIGLAASFAGARLFRWEAGLRTGRRGIGWLMVAFSSWALIGAAAIVRDSRQPAYPPDTVYATISDAQIAKISYEGLPGDQELVTRLAPPLNAVQAAAVKHHASAFESWPQGRVEDPGQAVRNIVCIAAIADICADPREAEIARLVYVHLCDNFDRQLLRRSLAWIIMLPGDGSVVTRAPSFGLSRSPSEEVVRQRSVLYAKKFLGRLEGVLHD